MKVLVVRFSSIGDIVLTTPVVRCLHQIKDVEVHFLTKKTFGSLLEHNPYLEKCLTIDKKIEEVLPQLKEEQYDCIIDLHRNLRTIKLTSLLGVKAFRFNKLNFKKWLLTNFNINRLPNIHIVDRYMAAVKPLGVRNDGKGLDFFIPDDQMVDMQTILGSSTKFIAVVIGAAHATKRLPTHKLITLCQSIQYPIVLIGGPSDKNTGELIKKEAGAHVINTCGAYSILQSASIITQSHLVVTHDTGMMHIAAALHKNIISIWGNTVPAFGMYPYVGAQPDKNIIIEDLELSCRPCSKIGYDQCPKGHFKCMEDISVESILEAMEVYD